MKACDDNEPSFNQVIEYLYIGDKRTARDREMLKGLGVTHVLNATSEVRNYFEKEPGFSYLNLPCMDTDAANMAPFFDQAVTFIHGARQEGHSVLVHCQQGVSRSAALVLAYLIKAERKPLAEAYTLLRSKRSSCKVRPNFLTQLVTWEKGLNGVRGKPEGKKTEATKRKDVEGGESTEASQAPEPKVPRGPQGPPPKVKGPEGPPKVQEPLEAPAVKGPVKGPQGPPSKGPEKGPQLPPAKTPG